MKLVKIAITAAFALNMQAAFAKAVATTGEGSNCLAGTQSPQATRDESQPLRAQRVTRSVMASTQQQNPAPNDTKVHRDGKKGG